ncbi:hypothetical protein B0H13DRAFT_1630306 [Mycena leptocephala]|nr:hypothetical protein B0H13DRAFT_1630306 [Mycena leptocephala]
MSDEPPTYDRAGSRSESPPLIRKQPSGRHLAVASISTTCKTPGLLLRNGSKSETPRVTQPGTGLFAFCGKRTQPIELPAPVLLSVPTVQTAVIEDVRLMLQPNTGSITERMALLESCAELCTRQGIHFPLLLQEKSSFYSHTTLYWAIVNDLESPSAPFELVAAVLAHSQPLKPETIKDARRACISLRSQNMFQYLRSCPEFGALSEEDRFAFSPLLSSQTSMLKLDPNHGRPAARIQRQVQSSKFRKRMMLSQQIELEFIARDRLWRLTFFTPDNAPGLMTLQTGLLTKRGLCL